MKASFCTLVFGDTQADMAEAIPRLAKMGYHGLEFWDQYLCTADLGWLKETMDEHDLRIVQICPYFDFMTGEEAYRKSIMDARRYVEYARKLDAMYVRTYTGSIGSDDATSEQWDACVRGLKEICRLGEPYGIAFPLETHQVMHSGPNLTDRSATTLRLLEDVDMPNLKVNLQTPLLDEPINYTAEQLGEQVVHLHAHNWIGSWPNLTFLDSGDEDFADFMRVLKGKGFDGYISIEHGDHHSPYEVAEHEARYLKRLIAGEFWLGERLGIWRMRTALYIWQQASRQSLQ